MKKNSSNIIGIVKCIKKKFYLIPTTRTAINSYTILQCKPNLLDKLVTAKIISNSKKNPKVRIISTISSPQLLSDIAIHDYEISQDFTDNSLQELKKISAKVTTTGRVDLTHIPLVTIDDESAKDHDDAIYVEPDNNLDNKGGWKILVAIADVSNYVTPNSAIDNEARERGNSVYFPDQVVPMLPEKLSNNLCSLKPDVKRYCLAVWLIINKNGKLVSKQFIRGVMKSRAKLTYSAVQKCFNKQNTKYIKNKISLTNINYLYKAYQTLIKNKHKRGTLDVDIPEQQIILSSDLTVKRIGVRPRLDSHKLIEEFMILANVAASEFIDQNKLNYLSRIHDTPKEDKVNELYTFLKLNNIKINQDNACSYKKYLQIMQATKETVIEHTVKQLILRSQSQAVYSLDNIGHYGLHLSHYTHFTSPIRRYADITIHRAIIDLISTSNSYTTHNLDTLGNLLSLKERVATKAERDTNDRYAALYMKQQRYNNVQGKINGITEFAMFITLENTMIDAILPLKNVTGDYFILDSNLLCIKGRKTKKRFHIGDKINVNIEHICEISGKILLFYRS